MRRLLSCGVNCVLFVLCIVGFDGVIFSIILLRSSFGSWGTSVVFVSIFSPPSEVITSEHVNYECEWGLLCCFNGVVVVLIIGFDGIIVVNILSKSLSEMWDILARILSSLTPHSKVITYKLIGYGWLSVI